MIPADVEARHGLLCKRLLRAYCQPQQASEYAKVCVARYITHQSGSHQGGNVSIIFILISVPKRSCEFIVVLVQQAISCHRVIVREGSAGRAHQNYAPETHVELIVTVIRHHTQYDAAED